MSRWTRPWAAWGLGAYLLALAGVLLSPLSPEALVSWTTALVRDDLGWSSLRQGWVEFAANVALFAPLGFLVTALVRRLWAGVGAALLVSAAAEAVQVLLPGRSASPRDVLANVVGAAIGALLAVLVLRRLRRRLSPVAPEEGPDG